MAKDKRSFLLYVDTLETVEKLKDDEAGKLFKHLLRYVNDKDPEAPDRLTELVFEPIKQQLKRDLKAYRALIKKRSENGKKGGEASAAKRSKSKQNEASASSGGANQAVNVTDSDTVTDSVSDTETSDEKLKKEDSREKFFFINGEAQFVRVSEYQKQNFSAFIDQWVMKAPGQKDVKEAFLLQVFDAVDTKYHSHDFKDLNYVKNAFTYTWGELLKTTKKEKTTKSIYDAD